MEKGQRVTYLELEHFSERSLAEDARISIQHAEALTSQMLRSGIIKPLGDAPDQADGRIYQWTFVGIVYCLEVNVWVYPKYMKAESIDRNHFKTALRAIAALDGSRSWVEEDFQQPEHDAQIASGKLATYLRLIELHAEHGLYGNEQYSVELNGEGDIDWAQTIDRSLSVVQPPNVFYLDVYTRKRVIDSTNIVRLLHASILNRGASVLEDSGLADLLGINFPVLSGPEIEDLGDFETLLHLVEAELRGQYLTWKRQVLRLMRSLLTDELSEFEMTEPIVFGIRNFHVVWEAACSSFLGNDLNVPLTRLGIHELESGRLGSDITLASMVPTPTWNIGNEVIETARRLRPDLVRLLPINDGSEEKWLLGIFDAKYYVITTERSMSGSWQLRGEPELESVSKQFLYRTAYRELLRSRDVETVVNAFLLPGITNQVERLGQVTYPDVIEILPPPVANAIDVWLLPVEDVLRSLFEPAAADKNLFSILRREG